MKKSILRVLCMVFSVAVLASCSGGASKQASALLEKIPAQADYAFVGDVETVLASAEIQLSDKGITLPDYILSGIPGSEREVGKINEKLAEAGVDIAAMAVFGTYEGGEPVLLVHLNDADKFGKLFEGGYTVSEEGGMTVYTKSYSWSDDYKEQTVVTDDYAYICQGGSYGSGLIGLIKAADDKNYTTTAGGKYIAGGNVGGAAAHISSELVDMIARTADVPEYARPTLDLMRDTYLCAKFDLTSDEGKMTVQWVDADGKVVDFKTKENEGLTVTGTISRDIVEYLAPGTNAVLGFSVEGLDWEKLTDTVGNMLVAQRAISRSDLVMLNIATTYLENLDGTIAVGFGLTDGLASVAKLGYNRDMFNQMSLSMAVQTKSGKAEKMLNGVIALVEQTGMPYTKEANGISMQIPGNEETGNPISIYAAAFDEVLVISNEPITGKHSNAVSEGIDLGDCASAVAAVLPKDNRLMRELGIDCGVQVAVLGDMKNSAGTFSVKTVGSSDKLLTTIVKNCINVVNNAQAISEKFESYRPHYSWEDEVYDWDDDMEDYEEEAVEVIDSIVW